jgi:hypothetical protein
VFAEFWLGDKQKANSYAPKIFAQGKGPDGKKTRKTAFEGAHEPAIRVQQNLVQECGPPSKGWSRLAPGSARMMHPLGLCYAAGRSLLPPALRPPLAKIGPPDRCLHVQSVFVLQPVQAHLFGGPSAIGFSRHFEIVGKFLDREVSNRNFTNISTRHPRLGRRPQTSTDRGGLDPRRDQPEGDWGTSPYIVCEAHGSSRVFESVSSNIAPLTRQSSQPHLQTTSVNCRFWPPDAVQGSGTLRTSPPSQTASAPLGAYVSAPMAIARDRAGAPVDHKTT